MEGEHPTRPGKFGGRLLIGGKPGNKGGGTISYRVRQACAKAVEEGIPILAAIVQGDSGASPAEQSQAWERLAKYGIGPLKSVQIEDAQVASLAVRLVSEMFTPTNEQIREFADRLTTECANLADLDESDD